MQARYEAVRKPRATRLQELSAVNRTRYHMLDGPQQEKRNELMATSGDRTFAALGWLYQHDAAMAL
jgi:salicylate hydroxylase